MFYAARVAGEYITCVEPGRSLHKRWGIKSMGRSIAQMVGLDAQ